MKQFIKNNPTLVFGLGLPLLMIFIISIFAWIPSITVAPPQYDILYYSGNNYGNYQGLHINVENKKAKVFYRGESSSYYNQKFYIFSPSKGSVKEIVINLPPSFKDIQNEDDSDKITPINVPELENLVLDNSSTAPDGYQFSDDNRYHMSLVGEIFFSNRNRQGAFLKKDGNVVRIPQNDRNYYNNIQFIGWVVKQ